MDARTQKRFWKYVKKTDGCWLWIGAKDGPGYGKLHIRGKSDIGAHRLSWQIHRGAIPDGMFVLHRCDVRPCVNPDHLFLGTTTDNMRDMHAKGRWSRACWPLNLEIGQPITRERSMRSRRYDQNYAHTIAAKHGWKVATSTTERTITITRIS